MKLSEQIDDKFDIQEIFVMDSKLLAIEADSYRNDAQPGYRPKMVVRINILDSGKVLKTIKYEDKSNQQSTVENEKSTDFSEHEQLNRLIESDWKRVHLNH